MIQNGWKTAINTPTFLRISLELLLESCDLVEASCPVSSFQCASSALPFEFGIHVFGKWTGVVLGCFYNFSFGCTCMWEISMRVVEFWTWRPFEQHFVTNMIDWHLITLEVLLFPKALCSCWIAKIQVESAIFLVSFGLFCTLSALYPITAWKSVLFMKHLFDNTKYLLQHLLLFRINCPL